MEVNLSSFLGYHRQFVEVVWSFLRIFRINFVCCSLFFCRLLSGLILRSIPIKSDEVLRSMLQRIDLVVFCCIYIPLNAVIEYVSNLRLSNDTAYKILLRCYRRLHFRCGFFRYFVRMLWIIMDQSFFVGRLCSIFRVCTRPPPFAFIPGDSRGQIYRYLTRIKFFIDCHLPAPSIYIVFRINFSWTVTFSQLVETTLNGMVALGSNLYLWFLASRSLWENSYEGGL